MSSYEEMMVFVEELKKQLDRKLVIRKDREGSHISLNIL